MIFGIDRINEKRIALISESGRSFSYGQVRIAAAEVGRVLQGKSVVFCLCRNVPEAVIGYLGIMEQGSVPLLLGENPDRKQLKYLHEIYRPSYYWRSGEMNNPEEPSEDASVYGKEILRMGDYRLFATGLPSYETDGELALLLSSSGSTGSPKLIRLSRRNLESNAESIAQYLQLNESERPITSLPMQYTFGLSVINSHLTVGAAILMCEKSIVQKEFWDFFSAQEGTSLAGVPYTYEILKKIHFMDKDDLGNLRTLVQAGGHLPVELQEMFGKWCEQRGIKFFVMYGQTEATARMSYLPYEKLLSKIGSIGIAIPGGRFELRDEEGNVIEEPDRVGELVYYGPNVSLGYASCREDLNRPDDNRGVLHTGDMAMRDEDGYYKITGRLSRFVKIYGVRVGLDECENILKGLDLSGEFVCVGRDDNLIIYTNSKKNHEAADWLAKRLGLNERAFSCRYVETIPKTESGKKDYKMLNLRPAPYSLERQQKDRILTRELISLTKHHLLACPEYARMLRAMGTDLKQISDYRRLPFLPAGIFKETELISASGISADAKMPEGESAAAGKNTKASEGAGTEENAKTSESASAPGLKLLTSSGTTGQRRARIYLDGETRTAQQRVLSEIAADFLGPERRPMLIIDCPSTVKDTGEISAVAAGIKGFSIFGRERTFALKDDMSFDISAVREFAGKNKGEPKLIFGFTYIVWEYFIEPARKMFAGESLPFIDLSGSVLVHGGGWKKLEQLNISGEEFKEELSRLYNIEWIHDYYGMAEQAGSIFMECEEGHFHCSDYSGVLIRRPEDFSLCGVGEEGLIQVLSTLPKSYPGHSLLTEDVGVLLGEDNCPCGRMGAYFKVLGRMENAEIRGCSDTFEAD
ncbi:MAG: AMP-binding protein [Lachnospiraceae bacterium]|jgi:long-chain acyl-CoA synthetase